MHRNYRALLVLSAILLVSSLTPAQAQAQEEEKIRAAAGGGITVAGWQGQVDAGEAAKGAKLTDAKFSQDGSTMHFITGPAVTYWNPANTASGNYTVKAKFTEPKYMNVNDHPHPYGIVIGGNDLGTPQMSALYCSAYGSGTYIVRGFGPAPFRLSDGRPVAHAAVNKAAAPGASVTQEIAIAVSSDKVECIVNGTVVGSYPKSDAIGTGKLKSTDGVYGLRFAHNTEGEVTNFTMTKQ
ncbi:MAG: hypothetical protein EXQ56_05855 [Acidobacteria bacterium]|nr:hypothetical protein [Acidobacteriota bacterium]